MIFVVLFDESVFLKEAFVVVSMNDCDEQSAEYLNFS